MATKYNLGAGIQTWKTGKMPGIESVPGKCLEFDKFAWNFLNNNSVT